MIKQSEGIIAIMLKQGTKIISAREEDQHGFISQVDILKTGNIMNLFSFSFVMVTEDFYIVILPFEYSLQVFCYSDIIAPVQILLLSRSSWRNDFPLYQRVRIYLGVVIQSQCDSCVGFNLLLNIGWLLQANINCCSFVGVGVENNSFSKFTYIWGFEMMVTLYRVHQPCIFEIWMHLEEVFSQILGSFQILKISHQILRRNKIFIRGGIVGILQNHNLIHFEDRGYPCHFADEISPESLCLRNRQNRIRKTYSQMPKPIFLLKFGFLGLNLLVLFRLYLPMMIFLPIANFLILPIQNQLCLNFALIFFILFWLSDGRWRPPLHLLLVFTIFVNDCDFPFSHSTMILSNIQNLQTLTTNSTPSLFIASILTNLLQISE